MHMSSVPSSAASIIDRDALHALGVLVPIRFNPIKMLPGRHPLGRAGDGMRLLLLPACSLLHYQQQYPLEQLAAATQAVRSVSAKGNQM